MASFDELKSKMDKKYKREEEKPAPAVSTTIPSTTGSSSGVSSSVGSYDRNSFDAVRSRMNSKYGGTKSGSDSNRKITVNEWIDRVNQLNSSTNKSYRGWIGGDSGNELFDSINSQVDTLLSLGQTFFDQYDGNYEAIKAIRGVMDSIEGIRSNAQSYMDFYSQFDSYDDYKKYLESEKLREEMLSFDLDAGKINLDDLQSRYESARSAERTLSAIGDSEAWGAGPAASLPGYAQAEARLREALGDYESIEDLEKDLNENRQYYNQSRQLQNTEGMKADALEAPDFNRYSQQGSEIENPTKADAEGFIMFGDWNPFGKDVNNIVTYSRDNWEAIRMDEAQGHPTVGRSLYHYMTDEEVAIYNYYLAKEGEEKANQYLDNIEETLNYREATGIYEGTLENNLALEYLFGINAGADQFSSGIRNLFSDEDYIPTTSTQFASQMVREDLADAGFKLPDALGGSSVGQAGYDLVTTTSNMLPSILASSFVGAFNPVAGTVVGNTLLGASAAGNAYAEMLNMGYSKDQSRLYAAMVGASEAGLQYLLGGIGKLGGAVSGKAISGLLNNVDNAIARTALTLAGKMGSEFTEEYLQEVLTPWFQNISLGTENDISLFTPEALYSGLLGALTAGLMEGPVTIAGEVQTYQTGKNIQRAGVSADRLASLGKTFAADTVAYQLAGRVDENTGAYTIGRLFNEIGATLTEQNQSEITKSLVRKGIDTKSAVTIAKTLADVVEGASLSKTQAEVLDANPDIAKTFVDVIVNKNSTVNQRTTSYNKVLMDLAQEKSRRSGNNPSVASQERATEGSEAPEGNSTTMTEKPIERTLKASESGKTLITETGEEVSIQEIASIKDGKMTLKVYNGTEVKEVRADTVDFSSDAEAMVYDYVANMGVNASAANLLVKAYNPESGMSAEVYTNGIAEAYRYGQYNIPVQEMMDKGAFSADLTEFQRRTAYRIGQMFGGKEVSKAQSKATNASGKPSQKKNGNVHFDGDKSKLNPRQAVSINALEKVADALGIEIYLFESYQDGKNIVYKNAAGEVVPAPNGFFDPTDNSIHIDINAGQNGEQTILFTAAHELTHFIRKWSPAKFKVLANFLFEQYGKKGVSVESLIQNQITKAKKRGRDISYDTAYEEVVADSMETMLTDGNVAEKLALLKERDETLWEKIREFFSDLLAKIQEVYKDMNPNSAEGNHVAEMKDALEKIQSLFTEGLVEASENYQAAMESVIESDAKAISNDEIITDGAVVTDGNGTKFSIRSMKHDIADGKMFDDLVKYCGWSRSSVNKLRSQLEDLVEYMTPHRDILDMNEAYDMEGRRFSPYKPNSDPLYKISMDFSTLCSKRLLTQYVIEQLQLRENRPMSAEEQMAIRDMLNEYRKVEKGLQVACAMCYVEAARLKSPKQIQRWLDDPAPLLKDYFGKKNKAFNDSVKKAQADFKESKGYDREAPKKDMKPGDVNELNKIGPKMRSQYQMSAEEQAIVERAKSLPNSTYLTAGNLANLSETEPVIYDAYTAFVRTATRSKSLESDEPYYYGDSTRDNGNGIIVTDSFIEAVNRENGMRFSSWSDWRIIHLLDYITAVIDNSVRGAAMHGYTKFGDEVRVLGKTGMMFNMSGVAGTQTGLNEDGSLSFSPTESIDVEEAIQLRERFPETAGLQCIGVSDAHIIALLRSEIIDYIIPYHVSGLNKALRKMANIFGWKDYTGTQNASIDKSIKFENAADQEHWHEEPVFSEFFVGYDTSMTGIEAMKASADKYKQMCKDRGLTPKFNQFANEENYWKLLIDRKMINQKTGELIQQKPVQPIFDFDEIKGVVDRFVENYDSGLEQRALNHIVDNWDSIPQRIRDLKKADKSPKTKKAKKAADTLANETLAAWPTDGKLMLSDREYFVEDKYFRSQIGKWETLSHGSYVKVGVIGETHPLVSVGMPAGILRYDVSKLQANMEKHSSYLTKTLLNAIPNIIADPIAITEYSVENTVSVFGDVFVGNSPMMVGVTISKDRAGNDIGKVRTFNARADVGRLITDETVLYLNENKKRTRTWFQACGIQVPLGETKFGFIRSIAQKTKSVQSYSPPSELTPEQQKHFDYNQKQDKVGSTLKTLKGSSIKRSSKYGVGKEIGGEIYFHKDYADGIVPDETLDQAMRLLEEEHPGFEYNAMKYNPKTGVVTFQESPDFDTAREPVVGDYIAVNTEAGTTRTGHSNYIWHHKWNWVKNDYKGFDVEESWNWSKRWLSTLTEVSDGNGIQRWNSQLEKFGLPKDGEEVMLSDRDDRVAPVAQTYTSAGTSLPKQLPALFKDKNAVFVPGGTNVDIGAGKTPRSEEYLAEIGVSYYPFDPFNRSRESNSRTLNWLMEGNQADTVTCANVLNVIDMKAARSNVILEAAKAVKPDGTAYFTTYEGATDKNGKKAGDGVARQTGKDTFQNYRKTADYVYEIREWFDNVERKGSLIIAKEPKPNLPKATWEITPGEGILYSDRTISPITDSDIKKLEKHFGTTTNYNVAGYLLTDGKMLDFSGKHWGDTTSTIRQVDHRDVWDAWEHEDRDGVDEMFNMIGNGNIRLNPESGGINLAVMPNAQQMRTLRGYINHFGGEVIVDIDRVGGDTIHSVEYNRGTASDRVLNDIKTYFDTGVYPDQRRSVRDFLYQDRSDDSVSNRSLLANAMESAAQNDIERSKIEQYKKKIELINAEEQKLHELREEIRELSFAKGPRDTAKIRQLQFDANQAANRITTYDKQLLQLEASKPLQNVLQREKEMARNRAEQKGKEAMAAYREKTAKTQRELLERYRKSRQDAREGRSKTAMRRKIKDVVKELNTYLLKGTKDKHIMIGLQGAVASALDAVNMDTVGAEERIAKLQEKLMKAKTPEEKEAIAKTIGRVREQGDKMKDRLGNLKNAYSEIKNSTDPLIANSHDEVIEAKIEAVMESVGDTPLRNMTLDQLQDVYDLYKMVLTTIRQSNKAFKDAKKRDIAILGNNVMQEVEAVGGKKKMQIKGLDGLKKFGWNNLKPVYAFKAIGSKTLSGVFDNVRAGEDTWAKDVSEARAFYLQQSKAHGYDSWDFTKTYGFQSSSGMDFQLNLEQIMSLYAYSKREQALDHLQRGGIVFDESTEVTVKTKLGIPVTFNPTEATAYNISPETLSEIVSKLTKEQKAFVDAMQDYLSTVMGEKGNEVSLEMYGVKLFKEKFYFPLKSATQFMAKAKEKQNGEVKIKNSGFSKETVQKASNPIVLTPFMDVWADHVNEMSMYHAFVLPMEDFYRVFNYKTPTDEKMATESVEMYIQNAYGKGATKYIEQLLKDLNGGARSDPTAGFINKMMGKFKKGAVFASLSVVIQQPSAIARAAALVDTKYFIGRKLDSKGHKALWEEVKKYAPVAIIKEMGYFDTNMGMSTRDFIKSQEYSGIKDKAKAMVTDSGYRDEILSRAPALADEVSWCYIWNAVKRETQAKRPDLSVGSDAFLKAAGERFTEVIVNTQVYDSVLSRSANMRSKDTGMKMATAFMAEPTTTINMIVDGLIQGKRGNRKYAGAAIGAAIASQIINSILVSFVYAGRDDDEDKTYLEKYLGTLVGEIIDSMNPLTYIPFIKDIISIVQGYDVERSDMAVISDLVNAEKQLKSDKLSPYRKVENFAGSIAQIFGLPVKNLMRDARGIYQTVNSFLNGQQTTKSGIGYAIKSSLPKWLGGGDVSDRQQLYEAIINGDREHMNRVMSRFDDQSAIDSAIVKALRENDPRILEAAKARYNGDLDTYTRIARQIIAEGHFKQDYVVLAVNDEINNMKPDSEPSASKLKALYSYDDFGNAILDGDTAMANAVMSEIIRNDVANGKTQAEAEKNFASSASSEIREQFEEGNISESKAVNALVDFCGKSQDEAEKKVSEWAFKAEHGVNYSDRMDAYMSGDISNSELISILMDSGKTQEEAEKEFASDVRDYCRESFMDGMISESEAIRILVNDAGKSQEDAEIDIEYWNFKLEYPDVYVDDDWFDKYHEYVEASGIDIGVYMDYRNQVRSITGTEKKAGRMAVINSLPITSAQKDALYFSEGWAASRLYEAPWH